jgi:hypothetical protein
MSLFFILGTTQIDSWAGVGDLPMGAIQVKILLDDLRRCCMWTSTGRRSRPPSEGVYP